MAAAVTVDFTQFAGLQAKLDRLVGYMGDELREGIGAILESSARRRVSETKVGPDGTPWANWSKAYGKRRPAGKSLLHSDGHLLDSMQFETTADSIIVFAATEYAATHQFGDDRTVSIGAHTRTIRKAQGNQHVRRAAVTAQVPAHQQKRNIPARPFLGLGNEDVAEIEALVDNLAEEAFR